MKWFNKVKDYPTGNHASFTKEKNVYDSVVREIEAINDLLDCLIEDSDLEVFKDIFENSIRELRIIGNESLLCKKNMAKAKTKREYLQLQKELLKIQEKYEKALKKLKNDLLKSNQIVDLQNHISEITIIINRNARLIAFKGFIDKKSWSLEELEILREQISNRNVAIIDYIGRMR